MPIKDLLQVYKLFKNVSLLRKQNGFKYAGIVIGNRNHYHAFRPNNFSPRSDSSALSYFVCSQFLGSPGKA